MLHFEICNFSDNSDFPRVSRVMAPTPKNELKKSKTMNNIETLTDRQTSKKVFADLISVVAQVACQMN